MGANLSFTGRIVSGMLLEKIDDGLFKPHYERFSLVNLANFVLKHFNAQPIHEPYPLEHFISGISEGIEKIVFFLIDALGMSSLEKLMNRERVFHEYVVIEATSVFPTTTSAAITSLLTGATPVEHGVLGYILYIRQLGTLLNMIELSSPIVGKVTSTLSNRELMFEKTIFERLLEVGVKSFVLTSKTIRGSGLSNLVNVGASVRSYQSFGDMFSKFREILQENGPFFGFVYWGLLDSIGHKLGVDSDAFESELYWLLKMLMREILPVLPHNTLLIVLGDHGQIFTPWEKETWWSWKDEVSTFFSVPPGGEMRMMHIYTNQPDAVVQYLNEKYRDRALVLTKEQALNEKLFGEAVVVPGASVERIGDVVLIARENYSFYFKYTGKEESLKSKHGSLTQEELLVPLMIFRR